ncbi:hypothetical protein [Psychromarinibacter sp. S121]|uniref:hypothetical protein n=1 Tax=Psychromarinibacter sp. S121 TaxID=3415127 RepID=UPI003C7B2CFC
MGYYYSSVGGNSMFNQGAMETVQTSMNGVDPKTGRTLNGRVAGVITDSDEVIAIRDAISSGNYRQNRQSGEVLMPIYDEDFQVVAYERSIDPAKAMMLRRNEHLGEMLGAWAGRQTEERLAQSYNNMLIDRLKEAWDKGEREGREGEFVDLSDETLKDEVFKDAWAIIPRETKDYIRQIFGDDGFMVRRDMVPNAVGYRSASVSDAWDGASRMKQEVRQAIADTATFLLGRNAYRYLVTAEKAWQTGVSVAKQTIVIRSFIVPASNIASNVVQLAMNK